MVTTDFRAVGKMSDAELMEHFGLTELEVKNHRRAQRRHAEYRKRERERDDWIESLPPREKAVAKVNDHIAGWLGPRKEDVPSDPDFDLYINQKYPLESDRVVPKDDKEDFDSETGRGMWVANYIDYIGGYDRFDTETYSKLRRNGKGLVAIANDETKMATAIKDAETDPIAYDACLEIIMTVTLSEFGGLPHFLWGFLYDVLHGRRRRPSRPGKAPWANSWRDGRIALGVAIAIWEDPTLKPTRNVATDTTSACDIVAEALVAAGVKGIGYKRVVEIFLERPIRIVPNNPERKLGMTD